MAQRITHLFLYGTIGFHDCFLILSAGYIKCLLPSEHFVKETNNYSESECVATAAISEKSWGLGAVMVTLLVTITTIF